MTPSSKKVDARVRRLCLALPEASEKEAWEQPTFRVRNKMFATVGHGPGAWIPDQPGQPETTETTPAGIVFKPDPDERQALLAAGLPYYSPKYMGAKGWLGIIVDADTNWDEVQELIRTSYRIIAPKKLAALV